MPLNNRGGIYDQEWETFLFSSNLSLEQIEPVMKPYPESEGWSKVSQAVPKNILFHCSVYPAYKGYAKPKFNWEPR